MSINENNFSKIIFQGTKSHISIAALKRVSVQFEQYVTKQLNVEVV